MTGCAGRAWEQPSRSAADQGVGLLAEQLGMGHDDEALAAFRAFVSDPAGPPAERAEASIWMARVMEKSWNRDLPDGPEVEQATGADDEPAAEADESDTQ